MNNKTPCAYCGSRSNKLTKEHIIPSFLLRENPQKSVGYNVAADKYLSAEGVIKDVCDICNNNRLSALDRYGSKFYHTNSLDKFFNKQATINIEYDYDLLLRWFLKMSYNSVRLKKDFLEPFENLKDYILTGKNLPTGSKFSLFVEVIRSYKITEEKRKKLEPGDKNKKFIPPDAFNISQAFFVLKPNVPFPFRLIVLNAFHFSIFFFDKSFTKNNKKEIDNKFKRSNPYIYKINPSSNNLKLKVSTSDYSEVSEFNSEVRVNKLREYLNKK